MHAAGSAGPLVALCLFASQSAVLALTPVLADVASDLGVSTAAAGQLRTLSGLAAGVAAALVGLLAARVGLRELLVAGLAAVAAASALSAAAPAFWALAGAQVVLGVGIALAYSAAVAASAEWSPPALRSRALAVALLGPPGAWALAMPVVGVLGERSWRAVWLVPLVTTALAALLVRRRPATPPAARPAGLASVLRDPVVRRWAVGELLAFSAWAGALVYSGALLVEEHGTSPTTAGVLLGVAALAYLPGNLVFRRVVEQNERAVLVALALAGAVAVLVLYDARISPAFSCGAFALLSFVAGGRTLAGSSLGLEVGADRRLGVMGVRTAAMQAGYLVGAAAGGVALAAGGYAALGWVYAGLLVLGAAAHAPAGGPRRALR